MGLTGLLLRAGASRPHVLVAAVPGGTAARLAAEAELRRRGWPAAATPADADVLLIAGTPAPDIADAVAACWAAMPAPRARASTARPVEVAGALDAAHADLAAADHQRRLAAGNPQRADAPGGDQGHGMTGPHGHDMGGMEMPAGLPMAERAGDRDGLRLDQLHVPLGPILPDWPAGLVVRVALQGDVIQHAEVSAVGVAAAGGSYWTEPWRRAAAGELVTTGVAARRRAAARLDSLGRFLAVAGWDDAAACARAVRDGILSGVPSAALGPAMRRFARRVARSRLLAWSTRGIGFAPRPGEAGDVTARYRAWCRDLVDLIPLLDDGSPLDTAALEAPRGGPGTGAAASGSPLAVLPGLLEGTELAAARLIVASLDPDLDELATPVGADHGG